MKAITLIFPHQLFKQHPSINKSRTIVLVEEWLYFKQYNFHKQKLVLHRASMQCHKDLLLQKGFTVLYIEASEPHSDVRKLIGWLTIQQCEEIHYADVADDWLRRRLINACLHHNIKTVEYATPCFLNSPNDLKSFFEQKKKYFQTDFYIHERKKRNILLSAINQPEGGHWSFDADNRKKFPKTETIPNYKFPSENKYTKEAREYVKKMFADNYGTTASPFAENLFENSAYPCSFAEAENWLEDFLKHRFTHFGKYEDAIVQQENILFHSVLSPLLNIGLLTPQYVIDKCLEAAPALNVPLNSLEGFIRQIIGWREFIHLVYEREGRKQRTTNYWNFTRKIPSIFWKGETGIEPVDTVIKRVLKSGYTHHIERLMVLGNFMILCEFDPDEVYRWFMEMFVDAYDWVMVPNTYGMTQFADGGLMMTKPYISSSNYIMKMSDFKKGSWQQIWDGLFWRFMHMHRNFFSDNIRLSLLLKTFDRMEKGKKDKHIMEAEKFLHYLDGLNN